MAVVGMTSAIYLKHPKVPTELSLSAPASGAYTDDVQVTANLTSEGEPVAGRDVRLSLGSQGEVVTTDASGTATADIPLVDEPGAYRVEASFAGDEDGLPSDASLPFTLNRETTRVKYTGDTGASGKTVHLAARLTEDDGPVLAHKTVRFKVAGRVFELVTNGSGIAARDVRLTEHDPSEPVFVTFLGGRYFAPSSVRDRITWRR
jgi:hypothetical protein